MTAPGPTNIPDTESPVSTEDLRLAVRAATLYYLDGLTQAEVAQRLGVSRPTAGRLVARARAQGLRPGGAIMIHGEPNLPKKSRDYYANVDWTEGCIAVSNSDMVEIWLMTPPDTPIEILP